MHSALVRLTEDEINNIDWSKHTVIYEQDMKKKNLCDKLVRDIPNSYCAESINSKCDFKGEVNEAMVSKSEQRNKSNHFDMPVLSCHGISFNCCLPLSNRPLDYACCIDILCGMDVYLL